MAKKKAAKSNSTRPESTSASAKKTASGAKKSAKAESAPKKAAPKKKAVGKGAQTATAKKAVAPKPLATAPRQPEQPPTPEVATRVEAATQVIGRSLWDHLDRRKPSVFERRWWLDNILEWATQDESVKVQMFRFVDVLPSLKTSEAVARHLQEYFDEVRSHLPLAVRMGLDVAEPDSLLGKALAVNARINARKMAERFIAGTRSEEIITSLTRLRRKGLTFTLDLLGECVLSDDEADAYQQAYIDLINEVAPHTERWPVDPLLDYDERTQLPRCQVSLKLSALAANFKPIDPEGTAEEVKSRLRPIMETAREHDTAIHIDMENYAFKDLTLNIFKEICSEPEFADWRDVGIVVQAYLPEAEADLQDLRDWAEERGTSICVRLVKGAYWDSEVMNAEYRNWKTPVYQNKWESDANFERQTHFLMKHHEVLRPAIASHNLRSIAHAIAWAKELKVPSNCWEIQMLHGMAEEQQTLLSELGHRVRVYTPFGEMIPGMAYLVRRLLENTSNDSFLRHAHANDASIDELLQAPAPVA